MATDTTTFYLAFTTVFAGLGWLLWRIDRQGDRLQRRLDALLADRGSDAPNPKNDDTERAP